MQHYYTAIWFHKTNLIDTQFILTAKIIRVRFNIENQFNLLILA